MKQPLEQIINSLESDPFYAVRISDADTFRVICTNKTGAQMVDDAGSVTDYFNNVFATNKNIVIQVQRKNGSNYKAMGEPAKYSVEPEAQAQPQNTYPTTTAPITPEIINPGLMGSLQGLNAHQMIYNHMDYSRVIALNNKLELENETLREKVATLKEEALENKYSEAKAAGSKDMLTGLMGLVPEILTAVGSMKNGQAAANVVQAGLGHPTAEDLGIVKQSLVNDVKGISDAVASYLHFVLLGINTVPGFGEDLEKLLLNYQLIQADNAN